MLHIPYFPIISPYWVPFWLVVYIPLWKTWVRQLGWWHSQYFLGKIFQPCSSHHQAVIKSERCFFPAFFPLASLRGPAAQSQAFVACSESGLWNLDKKNWSHLVTFMDAMRKGILYHLILLRQTFPIFSTSCTSSRCGKVGTAEGFRVAPSQLHEQRERFGCLQRFQVLTAVILRVTWLLKQQNTMSRWATFVSMIVNHCQ